jgi:nitroimidazol reductase NimA-like FMN-containing flavoprotein (pyridoxamine 5'-phosphate oxidase superfamily)
MRRKDKEIKEKAEIEAIIAQASVCRLAMVDEDRPYIVPLCFGYREGALYFHSAGTGKKLDLLKKNNNVCFEFDVGTDVRPAGLACEWGMRYKSVIGFGTAMFVEDPRAKQEALDIIVAQYAGLSTGFRESALRKTVIVRVEIQRMTGKRSQ